ncbi:MAG: 2-oxoglutarate dehydrogenase E1 component [Micavibrio aeruginosavorus]|uniref:oxoglutarate dehydrogenase (succinyl-transferring) n=1 Tax=Micavibrio aeruginosavorus TaxID=349221 RepID=A0A7T5R3V6_9BACT|nr:MAG: 2-oxoglutarate dehydrogenase E1 component [Micavibrio aeruginosavorus]
MSASSERMTFLSGNNAEYIAHLYSQYLMSPNKVDESWRGFFDSLDDNEAALLRELQGASWTPEENRRNKNGFSSFAVGTGAADTAVGITTAQKAKASAPANQDDIRSAARDSVQALMLIRAYRARGHLIANLDPLGLKQASYHPELDPSFYGFTDADYDRPIFINGVLGMETATLREIVQVLKATYSGNIGVEYLHMTDPDQKAWIQQRIEGPRNHTDFSPEGKKAILQRLTAAETFEKFLHVKYTGTKRFGLDGGESLIPALEQVMKRGSQLGVEEVVLGMAHRGRLNVLTNVFSKPFTALFSEFQGRSSNPDDVQGSGDVKYHLGTSSDRVFDGKAVHLSLTANPSHLEAVNPVVIGKVRAKQAQRLDREAAKVVPILLHGDAAFAGQGLVAETLMISELPGYRVGGTIHIVTNNQIGFTTMPQYSRSGPYCTDIAKMLSAPIFHVNGDDPEAVVHVTRIATEFRQEFKKDVVIDIFCYRRFGHNEGDEPAFTQPLMYKTIRTQKTTREIYAAQLIGEGVVSADQAQAMVDEFNDYLEQAFEATKSYKPNKADYLEGAWTGLKVASGEERRGETSVTEKDMAALGKVLTAVPSSFNINPKIMRQLEAKQDMFKTGQGFDWATAEALAFGSLMQEGYKVRLSGQDVGRGTFSHRHAIMYDQETEQKYIPLQNVSAGQAPFEIHDSPLSEAAVLGFEYGYSLADPKALVLWEAQFGDFVNGAQVLIDQFICSSESKWLRMSGLVMLLPHGFEGQGPEHSSARPERFLQLCAEDNWQVANCTTPANYFHILRRQMVRDFRKPLVIMTPKSLLRHKLAISPMDMFTGESTFHRVLWDDARDKLAKGKDVKRVVLCSGKVYYDLYEEREKRGIKDVVILRLEQLYPFPGKALSKELTQYPNADIVWCQEEPRNQGYWAFVHERIEEVLVGMKHKTARPRYAGRIDAAAPATGLLKRHQEEQARLVSEALTI